MSEFFPFDLLVCPFPVDILYFFVHLPAVFIKLFNVLLRFYPGEPGKEPGSVIPSDLKLLVPELISILPGSHVLMLHAGVSEAGTGYIEFDNVLSV